MKKILLTLFLNSISLIIAAQSTKCHQKIALSGIGSVSVPCVFEFQSIELQKQADSLQQILHNRSEAISLPYDKIILQQHGLNAKLKNSFDTYVRVIIANLPRDIFGSSIPTQQELANMSNFMLDSIDNLLEEETIKTFNNTNFNTKLLSWDGSKILKINGLWALNYNYTRIVGNNEPVRVSIFRFFEGVRNFV